MTNRFTEKAQHALEAALREATRLGHTYVGSEHLLLGLLADHTSISYTVLTGRGVEAENICRALVDLSGEGRDSHVTPADMTPRMRKILTAAGTLARRYGRALVGSEHLLFALLSVGDCVAIRLLSSLGIDTDALRRDASAYLTASLCKDDATPQGEEEAAGAARPARRNDTRPRNERERKDAEPASPESIPGAPTLSRYGKDLTAAARAGLIDPVIGREAETERLIQILTRRQKNNPCLVGEPGVGKTAVVEGLAKRLADGKVPDALQGHMIVTVDIPGMLAGAKYRGEFEERLKSVMAEVSRLPSVILFIDEMHTIVGAGAAEGAVDAANILKPALARGEIHVIGATTETEYRLHIEKDAALERRFQAVTVTEPDEKAALAILRGLRSRYEAHHGLLITEEAIEAAVTLSIRYLPDRHLPDKALDLLDEAASRRRLAAIPRAKDDASNEASVLAEAKESALRAGDLAEAARIATKEKAILSDAQEKDSDLHIESAESVPPVQVSGEDVAAVLTQWTGIPVSRLMDSESERLGRLEKDLSDVVVGQSAAISGIARAIRRSRLGLSDPRRPIGSFLFTGPSGVGKTALCRALSASLFGDERALIRFDMSEYMEKHSVSRLIGSPPGYVGHEEGGRLTEQVRRRPYSVLLFDEIEKAHPAIFDLLLQVLDNGMLTDSTGRHVDFRNTVIILTSNLGSDSSSHRSVGFGTSEQTSADLDRLKAMTAVRETFRPEFLNRLDAIIPFSPLSHDHAREITKRILNELAERARTPGLTLLYDNDVVAHIVSNGFEAASGARSLHRAAVQMVEDPLTSALISGELRAGDCVRLTVRDGKIVLEKENQ